MDMIYKAGISSFAYSFACGNRPFQKPDHIMTPFDLIDKAAVIGADVVQIGDNMPLEAYADGELEKIRSYAEANGIELEAGMRKATAERLSEYIRIAGKIGAHMLRLIIDGKDYEPDLQESRRIFSSMIPQLEENDVILGVENHDRFSSLEYARVIRTVDHPRVGLTVDTVNSLSAEEPIDEVLKNMAPYCVCLHVKDYMIKRYNGGGGLKITGACPGKGRLDIQKCFEECRTRSAYSFNIILESWMEPCGTLMETLRMEDEWARAGIVLLKDMIVSV